MAHAELRGFDPAMTRRIAQDPAVRMRILRTIHSAALGIHRRRVREFAAGDDGEFPTWEQSFQLATEEVATLCWSLGTLVAVNERDVEVAFEMMADYR